MHCHFDWARYCDTKLTCDVHEVLHFLKVPQLFVVRDEVVAARQHAADADQFFGLTKLS